MDTTSLTTPGAIMSDLEDLWQKFDTLFGSLKPEDWSRKHGKHWTMADVPYHLSYFDRDIVADPVVLGPNVPPERQQVQRTLNELSAWNVRQFAARPAGQTPEQSLAQMHASRDAIRKAVADMSDADLERPAFIQLAGGGWLTARWALIMCRGHTWNHFEQFRLHLGRSTPLPSPTTVHGALAFYANMLRALANPKEAQRTSLTVVLDFEGPGGGAWTLRVAGGTVSVAEEHAPRADLVMTQSPETFVKTLTQMHNPVVAMVTRKVKVRGLRNLGKFGKLFAEPKPDAAIEPMGQPVVS